MRLAKNILATICAIAGAFIVLFFRNYNGHVIPYPVFWWLLGITLLPISSWLFYSARKNVAKGKNKIVRQRIEKLKLEGEKITVNFDDCELLTGYKKVIDEGENVSSSLTTNLVIDYIDDEPAPYQDVETCVLIYKTEFQGTKINFFSPRIRKDVVTLEFQLGNKKQIDLYVDKTNPKNFWFDLDFLD
jgi:hypothetical protein